MKWMFKCITSSWYTCCMGSHQCVSGMPLFHSSTKACHSLSSELRLNSSTPLIPRERYSSSDTSCMLPGSLCPWDNSRVPREGSCLCVWPPYFNPREGTAKDSQNETHKSATCTVPGLPSVWLPVFLTLNQRGFNSCCTHERKTHPNLLYVSGYPGGFCFVSQTPLPQTPASWGVYHSDFLPLFLLYTELWEEYQPLWFSFPKHTEELMESVLNC